MQILSKGDHHVAVSLSERNLADLLAQVWEDGRPHAKIRLTESGVLLTVIGESDALHYADRPDALEAPEAPRPGPARPSCLPDHVQEALANLAAIPAVPTADLLTLTRFMVRAAHR